MIKPAGIYLESIAQNEIGHDLWGTYSAVSSLGLILSVILNPGFQQFLTIQIAKGNRTNLLVPLQKLQAVLFPIYLLLFLTIGCLLGYDYQQFQLLIVVALLFFAINSTYLLRAEMQGNQAYKLDTWLSNADKAFLIIGLITCLIINKELSLSVFLSLKGVSILLSLSILFTLSKKTSCLKSANKESISHKKIIAQTIPFALTISLNTLHERVDMIMLYELAGATATSVYSATYRIYDGLMMYLWIIGPYFFSRIAFQDKNPKAQLKLLKNGTTLLTVPLLYLAVFSLFYGELFFFMFDDTGELKNTMHSVLNWLFIPLLLNAICLVPVSRMMSKKQFKPIVIGTLAALLINITLNCIYIPAYGIRAAAIATAISTASISLTYFHYNRKEFALPTSYWFKMLVLLLLTMLFFTIAMYYRAHWLLTSLGAALLLVIMTIKMRLFTTKPIVTSEN